MSSEEAASMIQQQQQQQQEEQQEGSSPQPPGSSSPQLKPARSSKISFSVDSLLSGGSTRRSPLELAIEGGKRYRDLVIEHHQQQQHNPASRELLARLGPFAAAASRPGLLVPKDFSRSGMSPTTRLAELRRELMLRKDEGSEEQPGCRDDRSEGGRGSSSPTSRLQFDERSGADSPRSTQEYARSDDEDLNVMDSDEEHERQQEKSNPSVVVPQPIHPGQAPGRPPAGGGGAGGGTYPGMGPGWGAASGGAFPHSLAGFAWLPPPHPHSPHGHLYNPHGGATSPNGEFINF